MAVTYRLSFDDVWKYVARVIWIKMRVHVFVMKFSVNLMMDFAVFNGVMVEWDDEVEVMNQEWLLDVNVMGICGG